MFLTKSSSLLDAFFNVVYPQDCCICQREVRRRHLGVVCEECWQSTTLFTDFESICWKCGVPLLFPKQFASKDLRCRKCDSQPFTTARAVGIYEKALRQSVLELKRRPNMARQLQLLLQAVASLSPFHQCTRIVPVPLHPVRERARGFNQAAVIARTVSVATGLAVDYRSLVRILYSEKHRAGLDAKGRRETVSNAFEVTQQRVIQGENILLVDDVLTTGATANSCAAVLLEAGAGTVSVLTIARSRR